MRVREPVKILMSPALPMASDLRLVKISLPSKETVSLASIIIFPASPCPAVEVSSRAPLATSRKLVLMVMLPPSPTVFNGTSLKAPLKKPSNLTFSKALILIFPASPCPAAEVSSRAPLATSRKRVVILISPPLPTASFPGRGVTLLDAPVNNPSVNFTVSVAIILILPPFPCPELLAFRNALLAISTEPLLMLISPAFPIPFLVTMV